VLAYTLLAQEPAPPAGGAAAKPQGGFDIFTILMFALPLVFLWLIVFRPARKQEAERKLTLASLKKNDEVVTIGGVLGTVVGIKEKGPDGAVSQDDEITLRVEGAKIRFIRSAIARILSRGDESKDADNSNKTT
jgi:preprotein translocase subunit YajC